MSEDKKVLLEKIREFEARTGHTVDSYPDDPDNTASVLKEHRYLSKPLSADEAKRQMFAKSRRGFLVGGAVGLLGVFGWRWMPDATKADLLRRTFAFNERVSQIFYSPKRLAAEFPAKDLTAARINGDAGMTSEFDPTKWTLRVGSLIGPDQDMILTLDDIKKLPRTDMIIEFKCIEGWSTITHFAGVRFSDFAKPFAPKVSLTMPSETTEYPFDLLPYVSLSTPDGGYYVGWDTQAIMHPQTLLAYEMNGAPLTNEHGAPLRLASPTKYGIKQIKRIGRIEFTNERPRDFWAQPENGAYDWYAGL